VVTTEVIDGDALTQQPIIDQALFADALGVRPLVLLHEQPDGLKGLGISIGAALGGVGEPSYQAILDMGDDIVVGETWLAMRAPSGGVFDDPAGGRDGVVVAEWLDIEVISPDGTTRVARRPVFDLVGAEARARGPVDVSAIPDPPLAAVTSATPDEFLPLRSLWFLAVATGATSLGSLSGVGDPDDEVAGVGLNASLYHVARDEMSAALALDRGVRTFLDGPNIAAYVVGADAAAGGGFVVTDRVDLLHRALGTLPLADQASVAPAGIVAGVLGHVVERAQAGEGFGDLFPATGPLPVPVSAGAIIDAAVDQGIELRVMRGSRPDDLLWPVAAAAQLDASLADGWVAIAPSSPVPIGDGMRLGWWLVDPLTGVTVDQLDDGGGAVLAEFGKKLRAIVTWARPWFCLGLGVAERLHLIHDLVEGHIGAALIGAAAGSAIHRIACH
jgi:hypothetical protein